jgi:hypothetical protein
MQMCRLEVQAVFTKQKQFFTKADDDVTGNRNTIIACCEVQAIFTKQKQFFTNADYDVTGNRNTIIACCVTQFNVQ